MLKKCASVGPLMKRKIVCHFKYNDTCGISLIKNIVEARRRSCKAKKTLWVDAISKEMSNVKVAFCVLDDGGMAPRDHHFVKCYIIFDTKM